MIQKSVSAGVLRWYVMPVIVCRTPEAAANSRHVVRLRWMCQCEVLVEKNPALSERPELGLKGDQMRFIEQ